MTTASTSRPTSYIPITIADGIRTSMGRDPDKVAFREGGRGAHLQGAGRADRPGRERRYDGLGLQPGDRAAILSPNTLEFVEIVSASPTQVSRRR